MKTTDMVAEFLAKQGIEKVYTVSGGGDLHLIDSICKRSDIRIICPQNEQNAAYAADACARLSGIGCALATSGPGATHLVSGIATSYYDSIPVLYLTGNQTRQRLGTGLGVRQFGFQSMPFVELCKTITKYAVIIMDPLDTLYELEKALWIAKEGRPGPVVVDIPDDIQRADVDPAAMRHFTRFVENYTTSVNPAKVIPSLLTADRPVLALGWGVHLAGGRKEAWEMVDRLGIPVVTTWGGADIMVGHPLFVGTWGTHGVRAANFAIQKADLVIAIGTRLDTKATGSPASSFAPKAHLIMVDVDGAELDKMEKIGRRCQTEQADAVEYMRQLQVEGDFTAWRTQIEGWKKDFPAVDPSYPMTSPYRLMEELGKYLTPEDIVVSDTGCPLAWAMQVLPFKGRFIHAFNQTPMGYGLGGAIGAAGQMRGTKGRVILLTGDGGLSECINELATVKKHNLNIRVILFNNFGHQMCRQTQRQWLGGVYHGTSSKDLATPNFSEVALAYGITVVHQLQHLFDVFAPAFLEVMVDENEGVTPQVRFGKSIEDADPELPEGVLQRIMES